MQVVRRVVVHVAEVVLLLALVGSPASAQTIVINPTTVIFIASTDHDRTITIAGETVPMLTRYELRIFLDGATDPITRADLGKPTPDANREVRATPSALLGLPLGGFRAVVAAIGPGGESLSDPSNPFARMGPPRAATNVRVEAGS